MVFLWYSYGIPMVFLFKTDNQPIPPLPPGLTNWDRVVIINLQGSPEGRKKMNYLAIASMMVAMCLLKLLLTIELWTNDPKHLNSLNEEFRPLIIFEDLSEFSSRTGNDVGSWFSIGAEILLLLCLSNIGVQWNVEGKHMEKLVLGGLK